MSNAALNRLRIQTADYVSFSIPLAGPMVRFLAWIIDVGALIATMMFINPIIAMLGVISEDIAFGFYIAFNFAIVFLYGILLEWFWRGQTIGKRLMSLRVVDEQGLNLKLEQVIIRNLLRLVDRLPLMYMVGGVCMLLNGRNQRLGDIAAGTVVAYMPKIDIPNTIEVTDHKYNSFRKHPHLEARLRKNTPPDVAALALDSIVRRDDFDDESRVVLFRELASYFRESVDFPDEDTLGISDEQYVRNIIDSIYNTR